ncbi:MAG TPA: multidrug efflux RND transporter permease subunit [Methylomusa anaerophila]|uniref:Efflux pump membrane transporter BepE n=1 Tax=Methylomusa anaerophila TaxID=1930071 RepID=A0A348AMB4_9FIRM|nr:multidrug efflux RND transporter permease subunit [Methylomusa anaerophila]BBB92212.1 Efflux pump membrane transporter BepE [Methylomusa anaerophila]HML87775.1 multidrug efflux RND transporter permease subunit [Methylomusa anaerophila]
MANFFINRPVFAIVLSVLITIIGGIAAFNLPVAQYPQISPPTIAVSTNYWGANAEVVNQTVAQVIEQQVNGVEGMISMSSTSSDAGMYSLSVQFESGKDADNAAVQTQNRVAEATAGLPASVQAGGVTTRKSSSDMSLVFSLWADNDTYSPNFLKNYGSIYLVDNIKRVKGVGEVVEFGSDYSMRIWLQPEKMAQLGISASDVITAIEKQNVQAPAGALGKMPVDAGQEFQYTARVKGRLSDVKDFEDIIILAQADGSSVRLKDVARLELGSRDYTYESLTNGHPATMLAVKLTSDANAMETITNVKKVIEEAEKSFPEGMHYQIVIDTTQFVRESMTEVMKTFTEALLLVVVVVFLFLQSWRATLIPVLAIPVSLIGTFGAFIILGFTINTLTLFAMVLAIGLVVDDAIVVIEAVEYHMRYSGLTPLAATRRAMNEVSGPVVAIAFVLAAVFIPVAFFGGMMGVLYKQFALTIAVSMALSAVVALSLTPALCTLILKPHNPNTHDGALGRFFSSFNAWFEQQTEGYGRQLKKIIARSRLCMALLAVVVILLGGLYQLVPSSFVPQEDQGYYMASVSLPDAASLNRTGKTVQSFSATLKTQPGVADVLAVTGMDIVGGGAKSNAGTMFIGLAPWSERNTPELQINTNIRQTFMLGAKLPEGTVIAFNPPALPGLGMVGGFTMMLQNLNGDSLAKLDDISRQFIAAAQQRPEIGSITSNFKADTPGYEFDVDRQKAEKMGVSVDDIFMALQVFLGGTEVNDFNKFGRIYKVVVQAETPFRSDIDAMRHLYVKSSANNTMVPLNTLIQPRKVSAPSTISRFNGVQAVQLSGSPAAGYSSGQALAALEEVAAQILPSGYGYEWSGQSREEKESGNRAPLVFGLAIVFVFLCLAALYESWSVPFAVLLGVPLGLFGAFLFQYARNLENSVYMQIGLVMLIGLAAKNAILIVEFAKVRVDKGMEPVQAAIEAAKVRLRPIIMTSLAFIIGCVPLMLAGGAGAGARNAMGTAVVGGMLVATVLGIFLIPVFFVVVEKVTEKLKVLSNKEARRTEATSKIIIK